MHLRALRTIATAERTELNRNRHLRAEAHRAKTGRGQAKKLPDMDCGIAIQPGNESPSFGFEWKSHKRPPLAFLLGLDVGLAVGRGNLRAADEQNQPVSYTHLDVYKRQGRSTAPPPASLLKSSQGMERRSHSEMNPEAEWEAMRLESGDVRQRLIEAGVRELAKYGAQAFSLRRVAQSCGVSCAAPYRHFRDKQELIQAVADAINRDWSARQVRALEPLKDDVAAQLRAVCKEYLRFLRDNPNFCALITPVSYTHLDVYKRQVVGSVCAGVPRCLFHPRPSCAPHRKRGALWERSLWAAWGRSAGSRRGVKDASMKRSMETGPAQ